MRGRGTPNSLVSSNLSSRPRSPEFIILLYPLDVPIGLFSVCMHKVGDVRASNRGVH